MKHILNTIAVVSIAIVWVIFLVVLGHIDLSFYEDRVNQKISETLGSPLPKKQPIPEQKKQEVKKELPPVKEAAILPIGTSPFDSFEVIVETNTERIKQGLVPLTFNQKLGIVAGKKLADIFDHQYFAHVSPTGVSVEGLATTAGYSYAIIGENLALGKWETVEALLGSWMASPSHRANVLKPEYREIGVAVGRGIYQGEDVWVVVETFGTPIK